MKVLAIAIMLTLSLNNAESQIRYNNVMYFEGTRVGTVKRDTVAAREALRVYMKQRPNQQIYGHVVSAGLSRSLQHLMIRCVVRTGNNPYPLGLVFATLRVESDEPATFSSRQLKSFYVAITDTLNANVTRTYVFQQYLDVVTNEASRMLWNHYRLSSNPSLFGWTFTPMSVRRLHNR